MLQEARTEFGVPLEALELCTSSIRFALAKNEHAGNGKKSGSNGCQTFDVSIKNDYSGNLDLYVENVSYSKFDCLGTT